ncbi:MAG TPA: phospholipase [Methylomirabilota bacterium]|nr:phospholipase [Methylomirabilota bacterium]
MHEIAALDHRVSDDVDRAAILLHGRRRPPSDMRDLAGQLGLLAWRCVFPPADDASWYPKSFLKPVEVNEPSLDAAVGRVEAEVERLRDEGFAPERILVGGFSQGACVICEYLARRPTRHLGALILSGGLAGPAGTTWRPQVELEGMPALLTGSPADPWVPLARVRETADWLRASGARVRLEEFADREHVIDDRDIAAGVEFIAGLPDQG